MNCWDHALWKALPHLPDLLASCSTKTEKVSVHIFTEKLLIAMHFVLLSSILAVQTEQERGFTWLNRTSSWRRMLKQKLQMDFVVISEGATQFILCECNSSPDWGSSQSAQISGGNLGTLQSCQIPAPELLLLCSPARVHQPKSSVQWTGDKRFFLWQHQEKISHFL